MKKQEAYAAKSYFNRADNAQSSIEFSIAFVMAILFLILSCNLFVWINHNIVQRQRAYENTRVAAGYPIEPGKSDFYTPKRINLFVPGGYGNETYK